MKRINIALFIGLLVAFTYFVFEESYNDVSSLQSSVLRLHILANSDEECDQQLKLEIRDAILDEFSDVLNSENSIDSQKKALENLDTLSLVAQCVIYENGFEYSVKASLERIEFDERIYNDITMPAGTYDALRIEIGQAKGKNWWCVIFPSMCLSDSVCLNEAEEYFSDDEIIILKKPQKVEYKLKCFELFKRFGRFFRQ